MRADGREQISWMRHRRVQGNNSIQAANRQHTRCKHSVTLCFPLSRGLSLTTHSTLLYHECFCHSVMSTKARINVIFVPWFLRDSVNGVVNWMCPDNTIHLTHIPYPIQNRLLRGDITLFHARQDWVYWGLCYICTIYPFCWVGTETITFL